LQKLLDVGDTGGTMGTASRFGEDGKQNAGQNRNDGHDHEQLY
jgi:hypothetical protein